MKKTTLFLAIFALATVSAVHAVTDGFFNATTLSRALGEAPPAWTYAHQKRTHPRTETFALYTLAVEAMASPANRKELAPVLVDRIRRALTGGKEPESQGGLGGWTHGSFAWTLAFTRHTPAVWDALTADDKKRVETVMQAMAMAANFTLADGNDYRCMMDGDKNYGKTWNPNHVEGYVGVALAADYYFGTEALNSFFRTFDFDTFLARLNACGFSNIVACWTQTPNTRRALMDGGPFDPEDSRYGTGEGVRNHPFKYGSLGLSQAWGIYELRAKRMYSHVTRTEIPITGKDETTHVVVTDEKGVHLISPYEGQQGMCYEFLTTNAPRRGSNFRSSLNYVHEGWANSMATALALQVRKLWPTTPETNDIRSRIKVGTADFFFKADNGYAGFANGSASLSNAEKLERGGFFYSRAWWNEAVSKANAKSQSDRATDTKSPGTLLRE